MDFEGLALFHALKERHMTVIGRLEGLDGVPQPKKLFDLLADMGYAVLEGQPVEREKRRPALPNRRYLRIL